MGEFQAGKWIIGITIYFFFFFLLTTATVNATTEVNIRNNNQITVTDTGFLNKTFDITAGGCTGKSDKISFLGNINCIDLNLNDNLTCSNITGCTWQNDTLLFGLFLVEARCQGTVNNTAEGIVSGNTFCEASGFTTQLKCETFGCTYMNASDVANQRVNVGDIQPSSHSALSIWDSIKYVALFRAELGLGSFTLIFSFLFFWLPTIMLIYAVYMALPFLH